jgi:predicted Zn-dependent peptidase
MKVRFVVMALVATASLLSAQTSVAPPKVVFSEYRLKNGLRVILSNDKSAPVVAVNVTYNVGSRNERPGRTGFAHLFEHMMFQGSANVGKGEHMLLVQDNGGTMNGSTNKDRTNYYEEVPANQLDMALFLEADRMKSLDISQANLDNQRAVVQEERRQNYDNQAFGSMGETVDELMYDSFAYKHSTIGSMDDLNAAKLEDVRSFFNTYYAPNNAVLTVVGDFDEAALKGKIEKYFGGIPRGTEPPAVDMNESLGVAERRKFVKDPLARNCRYMMAFKTVTGDHPDAAALQLLAQIISGRSGRLTKAIVDEKKLATNISAGSSAGRGPGQFSFSGGITSLAKVEGLDKGLEAFITELQEKGVTEAELAKAKRVARARGIMGFGGRGGGGQTALSKANALGQNAVYFNDPDRTNKSLESIEGVTLERIQKVARVYLNKPNRVVVVYSPGGQVPAQNPDEMDGGN